MALAGRRDLEAAARVGAQVPAPQVPAVGAGVAALAVAVVPAARGNS